MKLMNKISKMTKSQTKSAIAEKRKAAQLKRDESRILAARLLIKTILDIDVEIVATTRDFYVVSEFPVKLEKQLDFLLVAALKGQTLDTLELPANSNLKRVVAQLKGA